MKQSIILLLLAGVLVAAAPQDPEATVRKKIREPLFVPDPLPPLDPKTHGKFEAAPGVVAERVTYGTQFGLRIPAVLYRPEKVTEKGPVHRIRDGRGLPSCSLPRFQRS